MRILIVGGPGVGKTTLAKQMAREYGLDHFCTDPQRLCDSGVNGVDDALDWGNASQWVCDNWIGKHAVIEGVGVSRALRKWHQTHPGEPVPADKIIHLREPKKILNSRQIGMSKGHETVWKDVSEWCMRAMHDAR